MASIREQAKEFMAKQGAELLKKHSLRRATHSKSVFDRFIR